jgi:ribonuclease P protein component
VKKNYSLKGIKIFREVLKRGKRLTKEGIQVIVLDMKNNGEMPNMSFNRDNKDSGIKIGISINSRYGKAIIRNKAKRRLRSICRELVPLMEEGYFILLRPNEDFKIFDYNRSKNNLHHLFLRAGIIRQ